MMSSMDMEDLLLTEIFDPSSANKLKNWESTEGAPNYDMLLQSLEIFGKMIGKGDNVNVVNEMDSPNRDLTAELFSTMSDKEVLNQFIPIKGIDYGQNTMPNDLLKKADKEENEIFDIPSADEFLPYKMIPHLNPVYKLSAAFKPVARLSTPKLNIESTVEDNLFEDADIDIEDEEEKEEKYTPEPQIKKTKLQKKIEDLEDSSARKIKRRKPRTYKYNPKPLQHKICRAFVPNDLKDTDYWERRKRNNEAAKKSREERRKKELEIMNNYDLMKEEYSQIKIENVQLKTRNKILEKEVIELKDQINAQ